MTPEERVVAAIAAVPELRGTRSVERLAGLTNANFKVEAPAGTFVVRIEAPDCDVLDIDRASALANCRMAAAAGVGAPFVAALPDDGVQIMLFLHWCLGLYAEAVAEFEGEEFERLLDAASAPSITPRAILRTDPRTARGGAPRGKPLARAPARCGPSIRLGPGPGAG